MTRRIHHVGTGATLERMVAHTAGYATSSPKEDTDSRYDWINPEMVRRCANPDLVVLRGWHYYELDTQVAALHEADRAAGRLLGVSAPCGGGGQDEENAVVMMYRLVALANVARGA